MLYVRNRKGKEKGRGNGAKGGGGGTLILLAHPIAAATSIKAINLSFGSSVS